MHGEELCNLVSPPVMHHHHQITEDEREKACNMHGKEKKFTHRVLVGKPEGNIPLRRPRHRWEVDDNDNKLDL